MLGGLSQHYPDGEGAWLRKIPAIDPNKTGGMRTKKNPAEAGRLME
jgi:hypothetical protein